MFIHIYPKIFVLRLFHENITVITIDGCTCSIASIQIIIISLMSSTLSYARPLKLCKQACYQVGYGIIRATKKSIPFSNCITKPVRMSAWNIDMSIAWFMDTLCET